MIMKTNFWKSAVALFMGLAAVVACQKPENEAPVLPVFPDEVIEENVEAGETVEITFDANLDWEVSIPSSEQNKYWLDDEGIPASKLSGVAGKQTVKVVFSEDVYYDANVVCEVTLAMAGEEKVIAKLTRLAINRTLTVYTAETNDWGFKKTFNTTPATAAALTTFPGVTEYTLPIQVVANYDWTLVIPEWCEGEIVVAEGQAAPETLSGKAGATVEIMLTGKLSETVANGAEGVLSFIDAAATDKNVELPFTLPAFGDRFEWSEPSTMTFDASGASATPAVAYVLAKKGFVVRALEWKGEYHDIAYASWVNVQIGDGDETEASEDLLQNLAVIFSTTANDGDARYADIFVFPAALANTPADAICDMNSNVCAFKPEYEKYCVGRLTQAGKPKPFATPVSTQEAMESVGTTFETLENAGIMQYDLPGFPIYQKITYSMEWSYEEAMFEINQPFASFKLFKDDQYPDGFFTTEVTNDETDWISLWVNGDKTKGKFNIDAVPASGSQVAAAFYDENGGKVAVILVEYSATGGSDSGFTIETSMGNAVVTAVDASSDTYMWLSSELGVSAVFNVTYGATSIINFSSAIANVSQFNMSLQASDSIPYYLPEDGMSLTLSKASASPTEAIIVLKDANYVNVAALVVTFQQ